MPRRRGGEEALLRSCRVGEGVFDSVTRLRGGVRAGSGESGFVAQMGIPHSGAFLQSPGLSNSGEDPEGGLLSFRNSSVVLTGKVGEDLS